MNKVLLALSILVFSAGASFAYYIEGQTSSVEVMKAQGYSDSAVIITDKANYYNGGLYSNYKRRFAKKNADGKYNDFYQKVKTYLDPTQDDGSFFEHQINFSNTWNNQTFPEYVTPEKPTRPVENL